MGAVALGVGRPQAFEGGTSNPFMAGRLSSFEFSDSSISSAEKAHRMASLSTVLQAYSGPTLETEARDALDQGVNLADQVQATVSAYQDDTTGSPFKDSYATNSPGRYMEDIATLIRGGFETRVFMTGIGGWDTHGDQGSASGRQADLIGRLDAAIGTFSDECKDMGVWNDTLILLSSEFGRRNFENGSNGTDHGHGNVFFAIGGNVTGGLYGPDITESDVADNNWLPYGLDYRDIFKEAVGNHLGGNTGLVFPETQDINTTLNYI
jgi:uncharacterized protein (DUF1501 family)